jgi:RNA polymerase sigma factor (sigma-70 family)
MDSVSQLIQDCEDVPLLSREEEAELLSRRLDPAAVDALVRANVKFVLRIARKYQGRGIDLCDLMQIALLGYMKAIERWDAAYGVRLNTYASYSWMRNYLCNAVQSGEPDVELLFDVAAPTIPESADTSELLKAMSKLGPQHRQVLDLKFNSAARTMDEIADTMGLCRSRVYQLQAEAFQQLREMLCESS